MTNSGIDTSLIAKDVHPGDDLFAHVNGKWSAGHEIPADRSMDGEFRRLYDEAELHVKQIIEDLAAGAAEEVDQEGNALTEAAKIGALFASFMDTERIRELGATPLGADLTLIRSVLDRDSLAKVLGALSRSGGPDVFGLWVDNNPDDPDSYVVYFEQSGLGLPDEAYYREEQHAKILAAYPGHISGLLELAGWTAADAARDAAAVVELETKIAANHWDVVESRDATKTHNPTPLSELIAANPQFNWNVWLAAQGVPEGKIDQIIVRQPSFITAAAQLLASEPLDSWIAWLNFHIISARASYLTDDFVEHNFAFYGRLLSGTPQLRDRWKRGVSLVQGVLGEAVGKVYVERHFPESHKQRMDELVSHLIEAYRESINELEWMGAETKEKALKKLDSFVPKIGYPVRWRDYSTLQINNQDLVGNVRRVNAAEFDREIDKLGKPVDRDEWFMTPQTVNAYYNPGLNEIVFPAGILQPPFFNAAAEDAVNFGGIGAVIGHEIGHGFDDQGSKYDGEGRLEDWWTEQDRAEFERRTGALIEQYNQYSPPQLNDDSYRVNGEFTIGENIGDLGGLAIAIKAYRRALGTSLDEAPVIDGLTGLQRLFIGWAQAWRTKGRDEEVIQRLATDPHSPAEFRCNGVVRNLPEFYEAFGVGEDHALYLSPEQRVKIW